MRHLKGSSKARGTGPTVPSLSLVQSTLWFLLAFRRQPFSEMGGHLVFQMMENVLCTPPQESSEPHPHFLPPLGPTSPRQELQPHLSGLQPQNQLLSWFSPFPASLLYWFIGTLKRVVGLSFVRFFVWLFVWKGIVWLIDCLVGMASTCGRTKGLLLTLCSRE